MDVIIHILVAAVAFYLGGTLLAGVHLKSFWQCILVAVVVAILNVTLGTFLKVITLGLLGFGLFNWLLNAVLIQVADWFLKDFQVRNFWWALALAAIVSIASSVMRGIVF